MFHNMNMTSPVDESNTLVSLVDRLLEQQKSHLSTSSMTTVLDDNKKIIQRRPRRRQTFSLITEADAHSESISVMILKATTSRVWHGIQRPWPTNPDQKHWSPEVLIHLCDLIQVTLFINKKILHTISLSECMTFLVFWRLQLGMKVRVPLRTANLHDIAWFTITNGTKPKSVTKNSSCCRQNP